MRDGYFRVKTKPKDKLEWGGKGMTDNTEFDYEFSVIKRNLPGVWDKLKAFIKQKQDEAIKTELYHIELTLMRHPTALRLVQQRIKELNNGKEA